MLKLTSPADDQSQADLFNSTVHAVVREKGAKEAVEEARTAVAVSKGASLSKALAGRMGRQIADTAIVRITSPRPVLSAVCGP